MKLLFFTDLHENKDSLLRLLKRGSEKDIDYLICAGDLTIFGKSLRYVLKNLNSLGKLVYIIPGNHESDEMLNNVLADYPFCINFNEKFVSLGDYVLLGYGGGGFSVEDERFRRIAREWYSTQQNKKIIFVTHGPAYGTKIDFMDGRHIGNRDFRKFIERIRPKLVVSGHLHETAGIVDVLGETKILNPGWDGMVVELN